jgi:hypothetical protein
VAYGIGFALALIVSTFAHATGFDRDRAFYPVVLIVVASYYVLFAVIGGSGQTTIIELIIMAGFVVAAVLGFKLNLWLVAAGLAAHGLFDSMHDVVSVNLGVPEWWPAFCLTFDIAAAGILAWLLVRSKLAVRPSRNAAGSEH